MRRLIRLLGLLSVAALVAAGCGGDDDDAPEAGGGTGGGTEQESEWPDLNGQSVEVVAAWTGTEQERFQLVLDRFAELTGASTTYVSGGDEVPAFLGPRLAGGNPPDVALLAQPAAIQNYVDQGVLQPIGDAVGDGFEDAFSEDWRELGTFDGELYALYFKAANKSLLWYNAPVLEDAGVEPPETWDDFVDAVQTTSDFGVPGLSIGGADGWPLTDWFENVYLRVAGGDMYRQLANHEIPWTDPSVIEALEAMAEVWTPDTIAGGSSGALGTTFVDSVVQMFADPPAAAMTAEGDFVAGTITGNTTATLGEDADVVPFPAFEEGENLVVGGGDAAVLLRDSEAGRALIRFLATAEAAEIWAEEGGFISPNQDVDAGVYPDDIIRTAAEGVVGADEFVFDLSDQVPTAFGGTPGQGMFKLLQDFLGNPADAAGIAAQLEAAAAAAG
jgi:ABC-type Fe3+ transport system substrate-binding protein